MPVSDIQVKSSLALALSALLIILPFFLNHLTGGRYVMAGLSLLVAVVLLAIALTTYWGHHHPLINLFALVPAIMLFLVAAFINQGVVAAFWTYPAALGVYFMLPERQAWLANAMLLVVALPCAWLFIDPGLALRLTATLIGVSVFSAIFVRIITLQQREIARRESHRREGMASVSHELRTPLAMVVAQVEAMRDGVRPRDNRQLDNLSRSMEHLNTLVDDLYQLTLADVGSLRCRAEPLRWDRIVAEAVEAARPRLEERGLILAVQLEAPVAITGDEQRLRQIVDNLLANCRRYCSAGDRVEVTLQCSLGQAVLRVVDSGPGVASQDLGALFDRFFRADSSRSRETGGVGLGLALVKAFAEAHKGQARAFHASPRGLGISVSIPLHRPPERDDHD